jgi:hypothetical protein
MKRLYCLFTITHGTYYTTIQGSEPTEDYTLLENLRGWITMIRKPSGLSTMEILETNEACVPTESGLARLREVRSTLA